MKGQVGMDDVVLGHKSEHAAEAPRIGVHVDAVEAHRPGRHRGDTGDRLEQRRLARAARTDDCHELHQPGTVNDTASSSVTSPRLRTRTRRDSPATSMRTPWGRTLAAGVTVAGVVVSNAACPSFS